MLDCSHGFKKKEIYYGKTADTVILLQSTRPQRANLHNLLSYTGIYAYLYDLKRICVTIKALQLKKTGLIKQLLFDQAFFLNIKPILYFFVYS